jgi:hypothetical protein
MAVYLRYLNLTNKRQSPRSVLYQPSQRPRRPSLHRAPPCPCRRERDAGVRARTGRRVVAGQLVILITTHVPVALPVYPRWRWPVADLDGPRRARARAAGRPTGGLLAISAADDGARPRSLVVSRTTCAR